MLLGKQVCFPSINIQKPRFPSNFPPLCHIQFSSSPISHLLMYPFFSWPYTFTKLIFRVYSEIYRFSQIGRHFYDVILQLPVSRPNIFYFGTSEVFMVIYVNYLAWGYFTAWRVLAMILISPWVSNSFSSHALNKRQVLFLFLIASWHYWVKIF